MKRQADLNHVMHDCANHPMVAQASNTMMDYFVHVSLSQNLVFQKNIPFASLTRGNLTILKRLCHSLIDTDLDLLYFN